jgi:hypothetical protein
MGAHCSKTESTNYYVVMIDYPKLGKEAVVWPEIKRETVVDLIRSGDYSNIVFIHYIDDMTVTDVTRDLMAAAQEDNR